jgi:hypothetical protein
MTASADIGWRSQSRRTDGWADACEMDAVAQMKRVAAIARISDLIISTCFRQKARRRRRRTSHRSRIHVARASLTRRRAIPPRNWSSVPPSLRKRPLTSSTQMRFSRTASLALSISTSLRAAASGSVKRLGSMYVMGCAEMGNVDQALLEPMAVEGFAAGASHHAVRPLRRQPFAGFPIAHISARSNRADRAMP